jgi:hypothetical protein
MHDTAYQIGTLAMNIYADLASASVLEIGSQAVNGSLRDNALPTTKYFGVDIAEGAGVDLVVEPGKPLPIEDGSYDLVMATSVFEHDPFFWMTFLEMCRAAKEGGYIYVNAPSNGVVHRYPQDNWRFYPDSGKALTSWAVSQGQHVTLVESFIAKREADIWNDFVAVFRKGRITRTLPSVFIHEHVPSSNILTWRSNEMIKPTEELEDLTLLHAATGRAETAERALEETGKERDALAEQAKALALKVEEFEKIREELRLRDNELIQRQEEIEQTRAELARAHSEREALVVEMTAELTRTQSDREELVTEIAALKDRTERQQTRTAAMLAEMERITNERDGLKDRIEQIEGSLERTQTEKQKLQARLDVRFKEIAQLTTMLVDLEACEKRSREQAEWLREAGAVLLMDTNTPAGRMRRFLPAALQAKRQRRLLRERGLFDGDAYLAAHPDVAADGADPLRHYLYHGVAENRSRS